MIRAIYIHVYVYAVSTPVENSGDSRSNSNWSELVRSKSSSWQELRVEDFDLLDSINNHINSDNELFQLNEFDLEADIHNQGFLVDSVSMSKESDSWLHDIDSDVFKYSINICKNHVLVENNIPKCFVDLKRNKSDSNMTSYLSTSLRKDPVLKVKSKSWIGLEN